MKKLLAPIIIAGFAAFAYAHSDPPGEVHPEIFIELDEFHVVFEVFGNDSVDDSVAYRNIYFSDGSIRKKKEPISKEVVANYLSETRYSGQEIGFYGKYTEYGDSIFRMRRHHFLKDGKPRLERVKETEILPIDLDWESYDIDLLADFAFRNGNLFVLATAVTGEPQGRNRNRALLIYHFDINTGSMVKAVSLGTPSFIYDFPGVSNLDVNGELISVVWNTETEDYSTNTLHLGIYNSTDLNFSREALNYPSTWNISISIASIDELLCIAHHGASKELSVNFKKIRQNNSVERNE